MKYTYLMEPENIKKELDLLWRRYQEILDNKNSNWEEMNEARAILFLTGHVYCEDIAPRAIERRLHLLKDKLSLINFFDMIDKNSAEIKKLREDELFAKLERFYNVIKEFKNKYTKGKYYIDEERFLEKYGEKNPQKEIKMGYKGEFVKDKK
jgi:hypothetical protein